MALVRIEDGPVAPYEQVREQLAGQVRDGSLAPGTRLPPVRALATELGLAAGTVARAYRELEALGLIETRGRAGSIVSGDGAGQAARAVAHDLAARMRELGVSEAEAVGLVRAAFASAPSGGSAHRS